MLRQKQYQPEYESDKTTPGTSGLCDFAWISAYKTQEPQQRFLGPPGQIRRWSKKVEKKNEKLQTIDIAAHNKRNTTYAMRTMIDFGVTDRKAADLHRRMNDCKLFEKDITEKFIRSSGPGGQKVNKTSTCVLLTHSPSSMSVKMQKTRSQRLNRYYARIRLCEILEQNLLGKQSPQSKKINKIRKQKDRRKRRTTSKPM